MEVAEREESAHVARTAADSPGMPAVEAARTEVEVAAAAVE